MKNVVAKIAGAGNDDVLVSERGVSLRLQHAGLRHARAADHGRRPVPGGVRRHPFGAAAGRAGRHLRRRARVRAGAGARGGRGRRRGVFIETHQDPDHAPSDGPNMVPLAGDGGLLRRLMAFDRVAKDARDGSRGERPAIEPAKDARR